jgi:predicted dehydrogenase/nucleoside-diphosphate-sugar epimerase
METRDYLPEKPLTVALFGGGKMAMHHAKAIGLQKGVRLAAIADPAADPSRVRETLQSDVPLFRRAEELLDEIAPDIVHVCTPPGTHAELACLALSRGAHVYVEKPFALTSRDAETILSKAKTAGRKVCAGHQLLYESPALRSHESLKNIGNILYVESYFSFRPVRRAMDGRSTISPLDQLVDILPHPVYLLLNFMKGISGNGEEVPVETQALEVSANGWVRGLFRCGGVAGNLVVTLQGRPVESYVRVVGANGCLLADFVRGTVVELPGPGTSGISKVINPYSQASQTISRTTRALLKRLFGKQKSYPGLAEIFHAFYESVRSGTAVPVSYPSILETVGICEEAHRRLKGADAKRREEAEAELRRRESDLPAPDRSRGGILVTGGTGVLGRVVAGELRNRNFSTRVIARKIPPAAERIPGVEYVTADLGEKLPSNLFDGIILVVHCAAETAGGKDAHERNSIGATRNILTAAAQNGVSKFLHISSIAVLRGSRESGRPVDESTPLLEDGLSRGPYVWGKVESERIAVELGKDLGVEVKIIRPGPLVDYDAFEAPGRLGREVGRYFVYIGSKGSRISLCDVRTAAGVIRTYAETFDLMPACLNLVEPDAPTRGALVSRLLQIRPDLRAVGLPSPLLRAANPFIKLLQRLLLPGRKPVDVYSAFASEKYNTSLAARIIGKTRESEQRA